MTDRQKPDGGAAFHVVKANGFDRGSFAEILIDGVPYPAQMVAQVVLAAKEFSEKDKG